MPIGSNKKESGRGGSHSYQHRVLRLLSEIASLSAAGGAAGATEATLRNLLNQFLQTTRTTSLSRYSTVGSVPAGARKVSFLNAGDINVTVQGGILKPGEMITFDAGAENDVLDVINFDATGSDLVVTTVV